MSQSTSGNIALDKSATLAEQLPIPEKIEMQNGIKPTMSTLAEKSYLDEATADVHFIFNKGTVRIPAHKILLKLRSDVFHAMFYGELKVKGDVQIDDTTADVFKEFLKTFYFDKPNIGMVHIPDVLQLVRKYCVTGGLQFYDDFLHATMKIDNVCRIYDLALEFQLASTKSRCEELISLFAKEILQSSDFLERPYETVLQIVSLNNFACDEYTIFLACIIWAKKDCLREEVDGTDLPDLRKQLQDILYQIRFRSMSQQHVGNVLRDYHRLFTNDELVDISLLALSLSDPKTSINKENRNNAWELREPRDLLSCEFIDSTKWRKKELESFESFRFMSSENIILRQIRLRNLFFNNVRVEEYELGNLKLEIVDKSNKEKFFSTNSASLPSLMFGSWCTLPAMIFIRKNVTYEIRLKYRDISTYKTYFTYVENFNEAVTCTARTASDHSSTFDEIKISIANVSSIDAMKFFKTPTF